MRTDSKNKRRGVGEVLFPKTKRELLTLFYLNEDKEYYLREIEKIINSSPGTLKRELEALVICDILKRKNSGNRIYYSLNRNSSIFEELKSIVVKTFGIAELLRSILVKFGDEIKIALIYGSTASGKNTTTSDIDLLVIGSVDFKSLLKALRPFEEKFNRQINTVQFQESIFIDKYAKEDHFVKSVFGNDIVFLIGSLDELN